MQAAPALQEFRYRSCLAFRLHQFNKWEALATMGKKSNSRLLKGIDDDLLVPRRANGTREPIRYFFNRSNDVTNMM